MLDKPMTIEKARTIAHAASLGRKKFGAQYNPPYRPYEILEAMVVLHAHSEAEAAGSVDKEELTACNRRYAALNARYTKLAKKSGVSTTDEEAQS